MCLDRVTAPTVDLQLWDQLPSFNQAAEVGGVVTWDKGKLTQEYEARYVNGYKSPFGRMLESPSSPPST